MRPGCETSTSTPGKEMSGFSVTGRRTKATMPMKSSTTNSTTGVTGCRIAHADMFFMAGVPSGGAAAVGATFTSSPSRRKPPAVATTRSCARESAADDRAGVRDAGDVHRVALDLVARR